MPVSVYGDKEIIKELQNLKDGLLDEKLHDAIQVGTALIWAEARQRVPIDTGALKQSIKTKVKKLTGTVYCDYPNTGRFRKTKTKKQAAGAKEYYAFAVEFGTKNMKEQPFLIPAAEARSPEIEQEMQKAMKEAIPNDKPAKS